MNHHLAWSLTPVISAYIKYKTLHCGIVSRKQCTCNGHSSKYSALHSKQGLIFRHCITAVHFHTDHSSFLFLCFKNYSISTDPKVKQEQTSHPKATQVSHRMSKHSAAHTFLALSFAIFYIQANRCLLTNFDMLSFTDISSMILSIQTDGKTTCS